MLIKTSVSKWTGPSVGNRRRVDGTSTEWILLTENMYNVQANGSYAKLYYVDNPYKNRVGNYVEISESIANIRIAYDATYNAEYITLPVYPNDDTSESTVDRDIPVKSISRAKLDPQSSDRSYLWYNEGMNSVRVLVNYDLEDLVDLADTGTTTTTTTA